MLLKSPFEIGSRLLPSIRVADCVLSLECVGSTHDGRDKYVMHFDFDNGSSHTEHGLKSGCGGASTQEMFASALCFLSAAGEAYRYQMSTGRESDNADLFAPAIMEWAYQHSDELSSLECEIEETPDLIVD